MSADKKYKIIISGGGTGGHIYPAIAVAQALQKKFNQVEILFVGAKGRMEMEKVPKAGYPIIGLWISGLQRSLSVKNLLFPFKVIISVWKSLSIIRSYKPDAVIGFGGYASGAMVYAATLKKIPAIIHEQNSFAGITNKILKNRVNSICVAYDNMGRFFPERKLIKTGNPIRMDLLEVDKNKSVAYAHFGLSENKKTVLVIGGSLGARTINESIFEGLHEFAKHDIQVLWQTGKNFSASTTVTQEGIKVTSFIYEMNLAYAIADVVISRAGALSIAELAQVRKPVILVPSPNVAENHQMKNALSLVELDAAVLVEDKDAKGNLVSTCIALVQNDIKQVQLKNNIATFAIPDAADRIVQEVVRVIKH
ncbi:MAG: undecaprenyldiphospho-muramoylpentapeptide beta-N-acetylglucosaminyltransferase [Bacteroidia bacterium]|jgi:UDP-N-acetylglucosamine--N-acetylmuramyl-(pentapeptide) pyrophosphoryl-undecaprenol N-acetylglucosamine transferase|nr:undecaprenyldiphospho-muramoylpentapeptide beta-N-acetylglucosaminyltransferase [Bacteroidia bacterium]